MELVTTSLLHVVGVCVSGSMGMAEWEYEMPPLLVVAPLGMVCWKKRDKVVAFYKSRNASFTACQQKKNDSGPGPF